VQDYKSCDKADCCTLHTDDSVSSHQSRHGEGQEFYRVAGFPGVLGAIDCTHVCIQSPGGENAELFRNHKGYFSLNVQAVCTPSMELTSVVARWPGCIFDIRYPKLRLRIFNQSQAVLSDI